MERSAYDLGYWARAADKPWSANPFDPKTEWELNKEWLRGWDDRDDWDLSQNPTREDD